MFKVFAGSENKASGKTPATDGSAPPRTVQRASKLMIYGAGGSVVFGIFGIIVALTNRASWVKYYEALNHESASQANSGFVAGVVFTLVVSIAAAAVWLWMARANRSGLSSARWASSALFLVWTYASYRTISSANTVVGLIELIIMLIIWGIGGAVIYQLWMPETTAFIRSAGAVTKSR
jgi:hypothetical protein